MTKTFICSLALAMSGLVTGNIVNAGIRVEEYSAKTANVNALIFFDSSGSLIVDATRNSKDAAEVAKAARQTGFDPKIIFVTHGHPDHYLGLGALKREFPHARVLVASQDVKNDILRLAENAERGHWFDDEPLMHPRSEQHPDGFDYQNEIQVLSGNYLELPSGSKLEVLAISTPTEAEHETLLYSKDLNSLFASDLAYNGVHLWLGRGVNVAAAREWQNRLTTLKAKYAPLKARIYPGHGAVATTDLFDVDVGYIDDFFQIISESKSQDEAKARMTAKYPTWEGADFNLNQSVKNHFQPPKK